MDPRDHLVAEDSPAAAVVAADQEPALERGRPYQVAPLPALVAKLELSYDYSQARDCGYHVIRVEVEGAALTITVIGVEGDGTSHSTEILDQFQIL